jgi:hypothetical protein
MPVSKITLIIQYFMLQIFLLKKTYKYNEHLSYPAGIRNFSDQQDFFRVYDARFCLEFGLTI